MSKQKKEDIRQFIVLRAGKPNEIVDLNIEDFNHEVFRILNVDIYEHVSLGKCLDVDLYMLVDEAGSIKDPLPPFNKYATYLYGHNIYGDSLLCTVDDNGYFGPIEGSTFLKLCHTFGASR